MSEKKKIETKGAETEVKASTTTDEDELKNTNSFEDGVDDTFLGADIGVEDGAFGSAYTVVLWVNGTPQGKAAGEDSIACTGGWFMGADQGVEPPPGLGFKPYTLVTTEGQEVAGFACRDLTFSPIRFRRCWVVDPGDGKPLLRFAHADYESAEAVGKPRGVCHIIAGLVGSPEDPVLLSFRGLTAKSVMGQGKERGIIPRYGSKVITAAKREARKAGRKNKTYPLCSFQLTIGPDRNKDGTPKYTKVGQGSNTSNITMPMWIDEPVGLVTKQDLSRLYVGHETFAIFQDLHRDTEEWRDQWTADKLVRRSGAPVEDEAGEEKNLPGDHQIPF